MPLSIHTTIRNMREVSDKDGFDDGDYEFLCRLEDAGAWVQVDCEATDGYYDVSFAGRTVAALSWYHLDGFDENGPVL